MNTLIEAKQADRDEIADQVKLFLSKGNKIEEVPLLEFDRPSKEVSFASARFYN